MRISRYVPSLTPCSTQPRMRSYGRRARETPTGRVALTSRLARTNSPIASIESVGVREPHLVAENSQSRQYVGSGNDSV